MTDRLFFALWPDRDLRSALERRLTPLTRGLAGRAQAPDQWHVTLEFLGAVADDRRPGVLAAADKVQVPPFEVEFDGLEHWRKPQVYCLVASRTPAALGSLVEQLRAGLALHGFSPETRDFRPHVTLARKIRMAPPGRLEPPLAWPAERFALVRSVTAPAGSRYEPLQWWNLGAAVR